MRYGPPADEFIIDVNSRLGASFSIDDLEWGIHVYEGVPVRVPTPKTLYRMKRDTARISDLGDAERLREKFGTEVD